MMRSMLIGCQAPLTCARPATVVPLFGHRQHKGLSHDRILRRQLHHRSPHCQAMLVTEIGEVVKAIHVSKTKAVLYASGGAVQAMTWLLLVPGASNTVLEANVPYARDALMEVLEGQEPSQYCSEATAVAMARSAYRRAAQLSPLGSHIVGLGATCSLATEPPKRGRCRAYVACHDGSKGTTHVTHLEFPSVPPTADGGCTNHQLPYGVSRQEQDDLTSRAVIKMLAEACGLHPDTVIVPGLPAATPATSATGEPPIQCTLHTSCLHSFRTCPSLSEADKAVSRSESPAAPPTLPLQGAIDAALDALMAGDVECVEVAGGQVTVGAPRKGLVLLPGSFNPLHKGHIELLAAAAASHQGQGRGAAFELSVGNADKGLLPVEEVRRRVSQFTSSGAAVVVTRAPLFTHKAALFKDTIFVVGYDTAVRMVMPKYYGPPLANANAPTAANTTAMVLDFERLRQAGCRFLVAGRKDDPTGQFLTLDDVEVPTALEDLYLPLLNFRVDLSSSQLRAEASAKAEAQAAADGGQARP